MCKLTRWLMVAIAPMVLAGVALGQPGRGQPGPDSGGQPSPQDMLARLFERMDTNGDGQITREEWRGPERSPR